MSLIRSAATVGGFTMMSRVFGFARELLIAATLGTGPVADAFYAAFRFPNLFRRLFGEGAFNAAFIPLFSKELEAGGLEAARVFARQVLSVLLVILLVLTALAELFMPYLVATVIAPFFTGEDKIALTVLLTRIMFPYLLFMSLVAMISGALNAFGKFAAAAFAPVVLNIVMIGGLLAVKFMDGTDEAFAGQVLAWCVAASGVLQLVLVYVALKREGFTLLPGWPRLTPAVKRLTILAIPGAIAGGITQINLLIGQMIASQKAGAIATLNYADRIYQLPLGVIGVAIGVALLPDISRKLRKGDFEAVHESQNRALEFSMLLTVPSAVALIAMPYPIVQILFEHGRFTASDTAATALALMAFAAGLPAFVLIKIFSPAFFAREDTSTPMFYAGLSVIVNVVGSLLLFGRYAHVGIALATTLAAWVNAGLLASTLSWRGYFRSDGRLWRHLVLIFLASAVMGGALLFANHQLIGWFTGDTGLLLRAATTLAMVLGGIAVYFALTSLTGVFALKDLRQAFRRER